jgi:cation transport protein ChaC
MKAATADSTTANRRRIAFSTDVRPPVVTRSLLQVGGMAEIYMRDAPYLRLLSEEEREASLDGIMRAKPEGSVWIFGYGSLIWNPAVKFVERRLAKVEGWHRAFCMSIVAGRASPASRGLMLGLDGGGECLGSAFRLDDADVRSELTLLWRREMLCRGAYVPRWLELHDEDGVGFGHAVAFTIDPAGEKYAGNMPAEIAVRRLATASGGLGSCADYLFQTRDGLRARGIPDLALEHLANRVEIALAA